MQFCEMMVIVVKFGGLLSSGQETNVIERHLSVSTYDEGCGHPDPRHWPGCVNIGVTWIQLGMSRSD
ncbi:hypothetical protein L917_19541 [Phytophthora nicotianae]|uniref:Uncharacterized protein n=1 Tax=Phytophthora nicotianae TaxID=4792 RepID=W2FR40_PHYNI|nr:hypothetical protein L915_19805 [Phytophthora nicotianae]ETL79911.1 hypothetical protein L917_19541 [Phytophthora nicotianae]